MRAAVPNTHKWQVDNGTVINEENPTLCFAQPKSYDIKHSFVDKTGDTVVLKQIIQIIDKGIIPNLIESKNSDIYIYPNPTTGLFNIKSKKQIIAIKIVNLLGQIVFIKSNLNVDNYQTDFLTNQLNGTYNLNITFKDLSCYNFKVIKM